MPQSWAARCGVRVPVEEAGELGARMGATMQLTGLSRMPVCLKTVYRAVRWCADRRERSLSGYHGEPGGSRRSALCAAAASMMIACAAATTAVAQDPISVSIVNAPDALEGTSMRFTLRFSQLPERPVEVNYTASATPGTLCTGCGTYILTLDAGHETGTIFVNTSRNTSSNDDETITVTLNYAQYATFPRVSIALGNASSTGTLRDVEYAISIRDAQGVTEGEVLEFVVSIDRVPSTTITVQYQIVFLDPAGYSGCTTNCPALTFELGGSTSRTIRVQTDVNTDSDIDNRAFVRLISATGGDISDGQASGAVFQQVPIISVADSPDTAAGQDLQFTVSIDSAPDTDLNVYYTVSYAGPDGNFSGCTADCAAIRFPSRIISNQTITINTAAAPGVTEHGTVTVTLTRVESVTADSTEVRISATGGSAMGVILNSAPTISIIDAQQVVEGGNLEFDVVLDAVPTTDVTVSYTVSVSGAAVYSGCTTNCSELTFFANGGTTQTILIRTVNDSDSDDRGIITVMLTGATRTIIDDGTAMGVVLSDLPQVRIADATPVFEGGTLAFVVSLGRSFDQQLRIDWSVSGDVEANDFAGGSLPRGQITFAIGETEKTISVETSSQLGGTNDANESDEEFTVSLTSFLGPSVEVAVSSATGTIYNVPELSVSDAVAVDEGETLVFTASIAQVKEADLDVSYTLNFTPAQGETVAPNQMAMSDRAVQAEDVHADDRDGGTVTIPAGQMTAGISIRTVDDDLYESQNEVVEIVVSYAELEDTTDQSARIATGELRETATPTVSAADARSVMEGQSLSFSVSLSRQHRETVLVRYEFVDPLTGQALSAEDFQQADGSRAKFEEASPTCDRTNPGEPYGDDNSMNCLWFTAGTAVKTVSLTTLADRIFERDPDETGSARIDGKIDIRIVDACLFGDGVVEPCPLADQLMVARGRATGTVIDADDDLVPKFRVNGGLVTEGQTAQFRISLSGTIAGGDPARTSDNIPTAYQNDITVDYVIRAPAGSACTAAVHNTDYSVAGLSGTLTFPAVSTIPGNITEQTVSVQTTDLPGFQGVRYLNIELSNPTGGAYFPTRGAGRFLIADRYRIGTVRIRDDDDPAPTITLTGPSSPVTEGQGSLSFSISVTGSFANSSLILVYRLGGSAQAGVDYSVPTGYSEVNGGTIEFTQGGSTTQEIVLATTDDSHQEPDEDIEVKLSTVNPCEELDGQRATGTIRDSGDSAWPMLTVSDAEASEGDPLRFPVSLSAAFGEVLEIPYEVLGFNLEETVTSTGGTLTIPMGDTSAEIVVETVENRVFEIDKSVVVRLTVPYDIEQNSVSVEARGTILNDDAVFTISSVAAEEGDDLVFQVSLSLAVNSDIEVPYTLGGTASSNDYSDPNPNNMFTVTMGSASAQITINTAEDTVNEPHETVIVTIDLPAGTEAIRRGMTAVGTIENDDPVFSVSPATVAEGGTLSFPVALSLPLEADYVLPYSLGGGNAVLDDDYSDPNSGMLMIAQGSTSATITVNTIEDSVEEADETFEVTINLPARTQEIGDGYTATGTIQNDDPIISVQPATVEEGGVLSFPITLSLPLEANYDLSYSLGGGTADSSDYSDPNNGMLTIAQGSTSAQLTVNTTEDAVEEADETIEVTLELPARTQAIEDGHTATGTIQNDDPIFSISDTTVVEGGSLVFPIELTLPLDANFTLMYTVSGMADSDAFADTDDYTDPNSGSLVIAMGSSAASITLDTVDDPRYELDEKITVTLDLPARTEAIRLGMTATGTIENDDPIISISAPSEAVEEGGDLVFRLTSSASLEGNIAIGYTIGGTVIPADYTDPNNGVVRMAQGSASVQFTINTINNLVIEADRILRISLDLPSPTDTIRFGYSAEGIILDNEPKFTVSDAKAVEEGGTMIFVVELSRNIEEGLVVPYAFAGTADANDYSGESSAVLPLNTSSKFAIIEVNTIDDSTYELDETVVVGLGIRDASNIASAIDTATGTIWNDDPLPEVSLSEVEERIIEGEVVRFSVNLSNPSFQTIAIPHQMSGTASIPTDYTTDVAGRSIVLTPGEVSKQFSIATVDDGEYEESETVVFELNSIQSRTATLGRSTAAIIILDNDDPPYVAITGEPVATEGGSLRFTVTMTGTSVGVQANPVDVHYAIGGEAVLTDYEEQAERVATISPGAVSATITINPIADTLDEPDESLEVTLTGVESAAAVFLSHKEDERTAVGTIVDANETPAVMIILENQNLAVKENAQDATLKFKVQLNIPSASEIVVPYTLGGTADVEDFAAGTRTSGMVTFAPEDDEKLILVEIADDSKDESNETVVVTLGSPSPSANAALSTNAAAITATGTIIDNDSPPVIAIESVNQVIEGEELGFTVSLNVSSGRDIVILYNVAGTATVGVDFFDPGNGRLIIASGQTSNQISLPTIGGDGEEDDETVVVTLSAPAPVESAGLGPFYFAVGTIRDGDASRYTIDSPSIVEGNAGSTYLEFTVNLVPALALTSTVEYSVSGGSAVGGADYRLVAPETLSFQAGETSKVFSVEIYGDRLIEDDETLIVSLDSPTSGALVHRVQGTGTGTIANDDFGFFIDSPSVEEGENGFVYMEYSVSLKSSDIPAGRNNIAEYTVEYAVTGGTAEAGVDYEALATGLLTFASGEPQRSIAVKVFGDVLAEDDETIEITLFNPRGGASISPEGEIGIGTILSRSSADATISVALENLVEGETEEDLTAVEFEVRLSQQQAFDVIVQYEVHDVDVRLRTRSLLYSSSTTIDDIHAGSFVQIPLASDVDVQSLGNLDIVITSVTARNAAGPVAFQAEIEGRQDTAGVIAATIYNFFSERRGEAALHALLGTGRSLGSTIVNVVWDRVNSTMVGESVSRATLGGRSIDTGAFAELDDRGRAVREVGRLLGVESMAADGTYQGAWNDTVIEGNASDFWKHVGYKEDGSLVDGTDFALAVSRRRDRSHFLTFWGKGSVSSYETESKVDSVPSIDGGLSSGHLGIDFRVKEHVLIGIALTQSRNESDFSFRSDADNNGSAVARFESATPYLHYNSPGGMGYWASFSTGNGMMEFHDGKGEVEADLALLMLAGGVHSGFTGSGRAALGIKADAFTGRIESEAAKGIGHIAEQEAEFTRLRVAIENIRERPIVGGGAIRSKFEVGALYDDGDDREGGGADVAGEVGFASPGQGIEIKGRGSAIIVHEQNGVGEWGVGLDFALSPRTGSRGLQLSIEPSWNAKVTGMSGSLPSQIDAVSSKPMKANAAIRARLGYGIGLMRERALATLYGEVRDSGEERGLRLGAELREIATRLGAFGFDIYGKREDSRRSGADNTIMLEGRLGY